MAGKIRVALIGGSDAIRKARREALDRSNGFSVIFDVDAFGLTQADVLEKTFDVAVIDQRLTNTSAYAFISGLQATANVSGVELGRFLISSTFSDPNLRIEAIESGAVDALFVSDGLERFIEVVSAASDPDADFGARELLHIVPETLIDSDKYGYADNALSSLDEKEATILKSFCDLKTDSQIAQIAQVPKLKVRNTLKKAQGLLMLNTRSQLLILLKRLGAI